MVDIQNCRWPSVTEGYMNFFETSKKEHILCSEKHLGYSMMRLNQNIDYTCHIRHQWLVRIYESCRILLQASNGLLLSTCRIFRQMKMRRYTGQQHGLSYTWTYSCHAAGHDGCSSCRMRTQCSKLQLQVQLPPQLQQQRWQLQHQHRRMQQK